MRNGRIVAVIDWSLLGMGEPANDLDPAWDLFTGKHRRAFREALSIDDATWARARGWAVKAVVGVLYYRDTNPGIVNRCRNRLRVMLMVVAAGSVGGDPVDDGVETFGFPAHLVVLAVA